MRTTQLILGISIFTLSFFIISMSIYGLYLAFSVSILLGLVCIIIEPSPLVFGVVMFFWDKNIPELIMGWL